MQIIEYNSLTNTVPRFSSNFEKTFSGSFLRLSSPVIWFSKIKASEDFSMIVAYMSLVFTHATAVAAFAYFREIISR